MSTETNMASVVMPSVFCKPVNHNIGAWVSTWDRIQPRSRKEPLSEVLLQCDLWCTYVRPMARRLGMWCMGK